MQTAARLRSWCRERGAGLIECAVWMAFVLGACGAAVYSLLQLMGENQGAMP